MHVVVAMSGGVDSSVAALRLRRAGHEVTGVFLRNGVSTGSSAAPSAGPAPRASLRQGCCSVRDACDAEEVAGILGVPFYALDHERDFQKIVGAFVDDYARGLTPNPCMVCNRDLKFGELWRFARSIGARAVASGHYAQVDSRLESGFEAEDPGASAGRTAFGSGGFVLRRAVDRAKDQSYVLASVDRSALEHSLFPLGGSLKEQVREEALQAGLPVHSKAESQEICFVPTGDYRDVLRRERPDLFREGPLVDSEGRELGTHEGAASFTVGQRRGLGISQGGPWYVVNTDPDTNRVKVGTRDEARVLRSILCAPNWLAEPLAIGGTWRGIVQVRAHHPGSEASARLLEDGSLEVLFDRPEVATPGQYGVLYDGDRVVVSGRFGRLPSDRDRNPLSLAGSVKSSDDSGR